MQSDREKRLRSLLVALLLLAVLTLACSDSGSGSSSSSSQADIGDEVRLHWGIEQVFVAIDRDAQRELDKVMSSRDEIGGNRLLASGRVFLVDDGTNVLVIDRGPYIVEVRILEGPHYGRSGWVVHEAVD